MSVIGRPLANSWLHASILAALTASGLLAQLSPQETPAEYQQAVDEAREIGTYMFTRYSVETAARQVLETEGVSDPRIQGMAVGTDADKLVARFMGVHEGELEILYEVKFEGVDQAELIRVDPPRQPSLDDAKAFFSKQAALAALPMRCADEYVALMSFSRGPDTPRDVYLVPIPSKEDEVVIGGFTRVTMADDGQTVLEVQALSKGCLTLPKPAANSSEPFLMTSHLVSSAPLATHVFLSMVHQLAFVVLTDAGQWGVAAREIVFLGPKPDEVATDASVPKPPAGLPDNWDHANESASEPAPWRERLMTWRATDEPEPPWWTDERLRGQFPPDYPNDLPVVFPPDEGDNRLELMWVQIFAYDAQRDRFLGHLLNQPRYIKSVEQGDRVVFGYDEVLQKALARHDGGNYEVLTLPPSALGGSLSELYQGTMHQRRSQNGNVEEEIEACIETLEEVIGNQAGSLAPQHRYLAHYTLGRCLSDAYETDRAIEQFEKALRLQPDALDPNMALLADLSVKIAENKESEVLEKRYLDQLALVRERYGDNPRVAQVLSMIFDRKNAGDLSVLTATEVARRERVGFGAMRWRMP